MKRLIIIVCAFLVLGAASWKIGRSARVHQWWADLTNEQLPAAENVNALPAENTNTAASPNLNANLNAAPAPLPAEKNLAVPFTTQAPAANWDADHEEFCEEATVVMAGRFFQGKDITSAADAESALQQVKLWELDNLGFYFDTTAEETASAIRGIYDLTVTLKENPTIEDIKRAIADNHLVIVPAAGRELGNPNFKVPGPIYHNLIIRGYTKTGKFITNDPGTRKGEEYIYTQDVVMSAMHDWVADGERTIAANGNANGRKVILIVSR